MKNSALLHVKSCSDMTDIAEEVLALCSRDLISSEAKYHASCYKSFVRICYDGTESGTPKSIDNPSDPLFEAVEEFCRELIRSPRVVEFKTIRKVMSDEAAKLGTELSSPSYKNLLRKISTRFKELNFVHQSHNNVLVYPNNPKVEDLILQNSKMKSELETMNHSMGDDTASVIKVAKILHDTILAHPEQMSWPPKEHDLLPDKVKMYIQNLLDVFCSTLLSGQSRASESTRATQLKKSIAQDIVYCVSGGKIKTPKVCCFLL